MTRPDGIRRTIGAYAQLIDDRRFEELAELYIEDAVHESRGEEYRGRAAIRDFLASVPLDGVTHVTANSVIDVDGDTARASTDWLALREAEGRWDVVARGRYYDQLVVRGGRWLFAERRSEHRLR